MPSASAGFSKSGFTANARFALVPDIVHAKSAASAPPRVHANVPTVSVSVIVPASIEPVPTFSLTVIASSASAAW